VARRFARGSGGRCVTPSTAFGLDDVTKFTADLLDRVERCGPGEETQCATLAGLHFRHGTNFNDLPAWQKRGTGLVWEEFDRDAVNPKTGEAVTARRRSVRRELDLPRGEEYAAFVRERVAAKRDGLTTAT
jgi:hypothetical protein